MNSENQQREEFVRLMKQLGWSAAETARQLGLSRSAVSQIISGKNKPKFALSALREAAGKVQPINNLAEAEGDYKTAAKAVDVKKIDEELRLMEVAIRKLRVSLRAMREKPQESLSTQIAGVSSRLASFAAAGAMFAEEAGLQKPVKYGTSPATGVPSGRKAQPSARTAEHPKSRSEAPEKAPTES